MRNPEGLGGVSPGEGKSHVIESSIINDIGIPLGLQAKFRPDTLLNRWDQWGCPAHHSLQGPSLSSHLLLLLFLMTCLVSSWGTSLHTGLSVLIVPVISHSAACVHFILLYLKIQPNFLTLSHGASTSSKPHLPATSSLPCRMLLE